MLIFFSLFFISSIILVLLIQFSPEGIEEKGEGFSYTGQQEHTQQSSQPNNWKNA